MGSKPQKPPQELINTSRSPRSAVEILQGKTRFLRRDAMLARCMLSSCVCPSVCLSGCPSQASIVSKRLDEWSWFLARKLPTVFVIRTFWFLKNKSTSFWRTCPKLEDLENFATLSRSTKLVDGRACGPHLQWSTQYGCLLRIRRP